MLPSSVLTCCCKRGLYACLSVYFSYTGDKIELAKIFLEQITWILSSKCY